jgi:hypothetical protein
MRGKNFSQLAHFRFFMILSFTEPFEDGDATLDSMEVARQAK